MNNTFGKLLSITSFGESHGLGIGCIVDGFPSNFPVAATDLQRELDRRKPGSSSLVSQRSEEDKVIILSGVFKGKTTASPIALFIKNSDAKSSDYNDLADVFRPGHADYTYTTKYQNRDYRGGGRASARLTAPIVAGGALAKRWLKHNHGVQVRSYNNGVGPNQFPFVHWHYTTSNPLAVATNYRTAIGNYMNTMMSSGNSVSSRSIVSASGIPAGIGEPVFNKISSNIAHGVMGINAVKGVSIGSCLLNSFAYGQDYNDPMTKLGFVSNYLGGIAGGISTGQDIIILVAVKPTSSISFFKRTMSGSGKDLVLRTKGRHDPCVGIRITPILESIVAIVLMDLMLQNQRQSGIPSFSTNPQHPKSYLY